MDSLDLVEKRIAELEGKFLLRFDELSELCDLERERDHLVGPGDSRHSEMLEHDLECQCITVYWGGYAYDIDLERISNQQDAMSVVSHVARKGWKHATAKRVALLIDEIMRAKGWRPFQRMMHPNEAPEPKPDVSKERAKMSAALRYETIKRDGYRCRACGFSVQDGAHLHVDHIIPVSKGGLTERGNLQTLCTVCNLGKGAA